MSLDWLERADVDVLAMQETKCSDEQFPTMPFLELGYDVGPLRFQPVERRGYRLASGPGRRRSRLRRPAHLEQQAGCGRGRRSACAGRHLRGVRVWSLYVPNGRALDDPHYTYKLDWLAALRDTAAGWLRDDPSAQIALVGDWNIAPTDEDVWSVEFFEGATHVSEPERKAFDAIVDAQFSDVVRPFTPGPGVYTYWDYTQLRFPKKQGMRIDFILGSPALAGRVAHAQIVREERKGKAPSDHAPVVVDLRRD